MPGTGMIVTDGWLHSFGFGQPTRSNIDRIIVRVVEPRGIIERYSLPGNSATRDIQSDGSATPCLSVFLSEIIHHVTGGD